MISLADLAPPMKALARDHVVSLRDVMDFEALPAEVQALARRVLLTGAQDAQPLAATVRMLAKAYREGWENCADEMTAPFLSDRDAERAAKEIIADGAA